MTFSILLRQPGFVAIDKPAGLPVIPGRDGDPDCVRTRLHAQLGQPIWVVHRLDRDTSGVLLFALDAATHRTLSMAFEAGKISKRYLAIVEGRLEQGGLIDKPLTEARKSRMRVARDGEPGKEARTRIAPRTYLKDATLVEAEPLTGRTHQIRVHLQAIGHPLIVDHQYGKKAPLMRGDEVVLARTPLHAERLIVDGAAIEAPLPRDLIEALALLEGGRP